MRTFFTSLALVVAIVGTGFAGMERNPAAPSGAIFPNPPSDAQWDPQFSYPVSYQGSDTVMSLVGSEFDGESFWTNQWNSNRIFEFDRDGNFVREFTIAGVSGLRDLAYDGQYWYGGAAGGTIWKMDFNAGTLVGTITGSFQCRAIAYNDDGDGGNGTFLVSNWGDPWWEVNRSGGIVRTFNVVTATSNYGGAYDNTCEAGPMLWIFDQGLGAGSPQYLLEWDLTVGVFTGDQYDVEADYGYAGIAGGCFITSDYQAGTVTIGGLLQTESPYPNTLFGYELCATENPFVPTIEPLNGTIFDPGDVVQYRCTVTNTSGSPATLTGEVYADVGAGITLQGPITLTVPGGRTLQRDFSSRIPNSAPPMDVDICIDANGAVDCYTITINP